MKEKVGGKRCSGKKVTRRQNGEENDEVKGKKNIVSISKRKNKQNKMIHTETERRAAKWSKERRRKAKKGAGKNHRQFYKFKKK